jgi:hypothetical protein
VVRARARELRALAAEKAAAFRARQAGRVTRALTLQTFRDGATDALTGNYLTLSVPGRWPANRWLTLRLRPNGSSRVPADPVDSPAAPVAKGPSPDL